MSQLQEVTVRVSQEGDASYLVSWLMDPKILCWFPLDSSREIEDAVKVWLSYVLCESAYTGCIDGVPCGMAVLYLNRYKKLKHQSLFAIIVDEKFRGRGVGTKIFEKLKQDAKEKFGVELLHLEVYEGNPAQALYERLGFKVYGRQEEFLKEKDGTYRNKINMQLDL